MRIPTSALLEAIKNPLTSKTKPPPPPSWWVTQTGRQTVGWITALSGGLYCGGITMANSFLLDRYKDAVQLYKNGFATPLTPGVIIRCHETLADMKSRLKLKNDNLVRFFCVLGMDMFHAGSTKLREGSIIGVPRNFSYSSKDEIERQDIVVENKPIEWGSEGGELLKESLILSGRAQKFGIARDITMSNTHYPYIYSSIGLSNLCAYYMITRTVNDKYLGLLRPRSFRIVVYSLTATFVFGVWATMNDVLTKYYERWADDQAGRIGLEYAKGGVEFYAKILQRNMALRSLMGPKGDKMYTFFGNDVEFLRQSHIPFTERKKTLETLAEELANANSNGGNQSINV